MEERFTVLRGRVGFRLAGKERIAEAGREIHAPAGMPHEWWNAGEEEARVRVDIRPAARFEVLMLNPFGLAQDGKTNVRGIANLLQLALVARDFSDVIRFTQPPPIVQSLLFGALAPIARLLGFRSSHAKYPSPAAQRRECRSSRKRLHASRRKAFTLSRSGSAVPATFFA